MVIETSTEILPDLVQVDLNETKDHLNKVLLEFFTNSFDIFVTSRKRVRRQNY